MKLIWIYCKLLCVDIWPWQGGFFVFGVGFYYITLHTVHLKNQRHPLTAEVRRCILFQKILKVKTSHRSADIVANDPPGEPARPRWTEKGKACRSVQNKVLHTVEQCEGSSLRDRASFRRWYLELFHGFSDGNPSKTKRRWCSETGTKAKKTNFSTQKATLFHCAEKSVLVSLIGRIPRCVWTLDSVNVQCQCPPWQVITGQWF